LKIVTFFQTNKIQKNVKLVVKMILRYMEGQIIMDPISKKYPNVLNLECAPSRMDLLFLMSFMETLFKTRVLPRDYTLDVSSKLVYKMKSGYIMVHVGSVEPMVNVIHGLWAFSIIMP
jgi:hypothetical protein